MFPPRADILNAGCLQGRRGTFMLGKVEICGVNTAKLPTLTAAETDALLRRAKDGDSAARERLVEGNLRLVLSVLQRFSGRGENADDLFQVGCVGLLKAIDNFDISQNVRFSTYGVPMIIGEIRRYLRDNSAIRVSRSMRDTAYRVLQAREKLQREQQREPTVEQIARERLILALRYSDGKTQMEVSGEIGISQAQVSRLEKNAIKSIKKNM